MNNIYTTTYDKLMMGEVDPSGRAFGYRFIVHAGAMSHTAFRTREGLDYWLNLLGLKQGENSAFNWFRIEGSYRRASHMTEQTFYALEGTLTPVIDNGDRTIGIVTVDEDGIRTLHHLNPNVHHRPKLSGLYGDIVPDGALLPEIADLFARRHGELQRRDIATPRP